MADSTSGAGATAPETGAPRRSRKRGLIIGAVAIFALGVGGAGAWFLMPEQRVAVLTMIGMAPPPPKPEVPVPVAPKFVELREMTVTMTDGSRPRQLKIHLAVELVAMDPAAQGSVEREVLSPRVYDALVLYLRTLRDVDVEGAIAVDRLRGDVFRRLDLLLRTPGGSGVVSDVLVTSLVIA